MADRNVRPPLLASARVGLAAVGIEICLGPG